MTLSGVVALWPLTWQTQVCWMLLRTARLSRCCFGQVVPHHGSAGCCLSAAVWELSSPH